MLLSVKKLAKAFGGVRAVDNVDWGAGQGEIHCIIGPNGAGKSTFFQLLMGSIRPDKGTITFAGVNITHKHSYQRVRLGLAVKPQTLGVYPELSVEQNLCIPLMRCTKPAELAEILEIELTTVGLLEKRSRLARQLSHGERQWLGLGMAAGSSPRLLLLDEPTAGMSYEETSRTADIIRSFCKQGMAVVVVEHDMAFVRDLAAPITVFHEGRVFARGSLAEIESHEEVCRLYLGKRKQMTEAAPGKVLE